MRNCYESGMNSDRNNYPGNDPVYRSFPDMLNAVVEYNFPPVILAVPETI